MKTATKNLEDDHVHILKLTDIMMNMSDRPVFIPGHVSAVINVIRNFADGLHHAKEEDLLFPELGKKGFSAESGPVAVMLNEHVQGRNFVNGMAESLELYKNGKTDAAKDLSDNMKGYAMLLQSHIAKENNILFRMADKVLSDDEQAALLKSFEKVESQRTANDSAQAYIKIIETLAAEYIS